MTRYEIEQYQAKALYKCVHSVDTKIFCSDYQRILTMETDKVVYAINDAIASKKLPEFISNEEEKSLPIRLLHIIT